MQLQPLTKKDFKRLHANGELILIAGGVPRDVQTTADMVQAKLDAGVNLSDYGINTTSHGFIDNSEHKVFQNEENNLVFLANSYEYGGRPAFNTCVYKIN